MDDNLKKLYEKVKINGIFKDMPQCINCSISCSAPKWVSWLLPEEIETYTKYGFDITQNGGANFFKDGHCHKCEDGTGCTIYNERSLECRITPLTILNIYGEPHWVLLKMCPVIGNSDEKTIASIMEKVIVSIAEIEPVITQKIGEEIKTICNSIDTFAKLKENIDYIKVKIMGLNN